MSILIDANLSQYVKGVYCQTIVIILYHLKMNLWYFCTYTETQKSVLKGLILVKQNYVCTILSHGMSN